MQPLPEKPCSTINHTQQICIISHVTYISFILFIIFFVCVVQEFTFILHDAAHPKTSGSSPDFKFKNDTNDIDEWHKVTDGVYAYSAYLDRRLKNGHFIRIIGGIQISKTKLNSTKCLVRYNSSATLVESVTKYEILTEHHNKPSRAVYIKCPVKTDDYPIYVAVVPKEWSHSSATRPSWMIVRDLHNHSVVPNIGVCVRPMFNYRDVFRFSEFIAYYEALGVRHFTFYNYDASEDIVMYLQALKAKNYSIDVLPWSLPPTLNSMWSLGQMASINDCIYRNMKQIMYVAIVDLDEFITPRHVMTLPQLLKKQDVAGKKVASFVMRSCVFCAEYEQDILPPSILPFTTQSSIRREIYIYPFLVRSKYILKPYMTEIAGVHQVWRFIYGWKRQYVPASEALVHHYRGHLCVWNKTLGKGEIDVESRKYLNYLMRSEAVDIWKRNFSNSSFYHS